LPLLVWPSPTAEVGTVVVVVVLAGGGGAISRVPGLVVGGLGGAAGGLVGAADGVASRSEAAGAAAAVVDGSCSPEVPIELGGFATAKGRGSAEVVARSQATPRNAAAPAMKSAVPARLRWTGVTNRRSAFANRRLSSLHLIQFTGDTSSTKTG
jgi:hypothetical protein